jgi:hypothetical protein
MGYVPSVPRFPRFLSPDFRPQISQISVPTFPGRPSRNETDRPSVFSDPLRGPEHTSTATNAALFEQLDIAIHANDLEADTVVVPCDPLTETGIVKTKGATQVLKARRPSRVGSRVRQSFISCKDRGFLMTFDFASRKGSPRFCTNFTSSKKDFPNQSQSEVLSVSREYLWMTE